VRSVPALLRACSELLIIAAACAAMLLIVTDAFAAVDAARCPPGEAWQGRPLAEPPPTTLHAPEHAEAAMADTQLRALDRALARAEAAQPELGSLSAAVLDASGALSAGHVRSDAATPFYWASVGKLATAVLIEQLIAEGRLDRSQTIDRFFDVPGRARITVDHLLAHTSGLPPQNERASGAARHRSLTEELADLREVGLVFCPGTRWGYSNPGYRILGALAETITGSDYARLVAERLAQPVQLPSFRALAAGETPDAMAAIAPPDGSAPIAPWMPGGAGSVVATAPDMARFLAAFFRGALLPPERVRDLFETLRPMYQPRLFYGRGVMAYEVVDARGKRWWYGHSGGVPGASAVVALAPAKGAVVAVALTGRGSAEATANALLGALPDLEQNAGPTQTTPTLDPAVAR
jgi:D-alanyl-D-alanine carboxypeptidase